MGARGDLGRRGGPGGAAPALHPFAARAAAGQVHLRLMGTTDLHAHVFAWDYYADRPSDAVGLARVATLAGAARAEAANAMLVDNGDFLQGTPLADHAAREGEGEGGDGGGGGGGGAAHPVIAAMNALGYDAATIGNHEFNYGLDFLTRALAGAAFPVVCANAVTARGATPRGDVPLLEPYVLLDRLLRDGAGGDHPVRIGFIGFVPPQIVDWDRRHLDGRVTTRDIVQSARAWVPRMKEAGADIVVALSHSGIGAERQGTGAEDASLALAGVEGIDALMTGHSHLVFPGGRFEGMAGVDAARGTLHGKPAVMAGARGSHLGVIDLMLARGDGGWRVLDAEAGTRPIHERRAGRAPAPTVGDDRAVLAAARRAHDATLAHIRRPAGRTEVPLHSYFALVSDGPAIGLVNRAQAWAVAGALCGTAWEGLPLLSAAAPFRAGGRGGPDDYTDIPAGDLTLRHIADLYPHPNALCAVAVTGAQVRDWLERSAGLFRRIVPWRADQPLLDADFPPHDFDAIDGVTYRIDPSRPARFHASGAVADAGAYRIVDLAFGGAPVDPDARFVIATNGYRAGGGGAFPGARGDTTVFEGHETNRDAILRYVAARGTVRPRAGAGWGFAPMPGTSAVFDTGPRAAAYPQDVEGPVIERAGDGADGFARYRIML